jgi:hypothetical protein
VPNTPLCVTLDMSPADRTQLEAETDDIYGFEAEPIAAPAAYLLNPKEACPATTGTVSHVVVTLDAAGNWRATAGAAKP